MTSSPLSAIGMGYLSGSWGQGFCPAAGLPPGALESRWVQNAGQKPGGGPEGPTPPYSKSGGVTLAIQES